VYDYHLILAIIGVFPALVGYSLYFRSIFRGLTKPHAFTWITFFLLDATVFAAQVIRGGGPGAWLTIAGALGNFAIIIFAIRWGEKHITKSDWISFTGALSGIVLWWLTNDPLVAVVIAALVNLLAVLPTLRKSFSKPFEESITIWGLDIIRFSLAVAALTSLNLTTALFPIATILTNATLVTMVLIRRCQLKI